MGAELAVDSLRLQGVGIELNVYDTERNSSKIRAILEENNLKQKIAAYKRPKNIFFVDELPRNTMGKVLKNILRDQHKDNFTTP